MYSAISVSMMVMDDVDNEIFGVAQFQKGVEKEQQSTRACCGFEVWQDRFQG
jgi:hypothetical protein